MSTSTGLPAACASRKAFSSKARGAARAGPPDADKAGAAIRVARNLRRFMWDMAMLLEKLGLKEKHIADIEGAVMLLYV